MNTEFRVFTTILEGQGPCAGRIAKLQPVVEKNGDVTTVTVPKAAMIGKKYNYVRIDSDMTTREAGDEGYMFFPTEFSWGVVKSAFTEREDMEYHSLISAMPVCGICGCKEAVYVQVKSMSSDCRFYVRTIGNRYYISPEIVLDQDDPDDDFVVEYRKMPYATYVDMAKVYRKYQLEEGGCVPLKERIKERPILKKAAESMEIRVRMGWKPLPTPVRRQTVENEPPMKIACTVEDLNKIIDRMHEKGIKQAEICLVGWGPGGHDGRFPQQYPCDERFGGDEALKAFISRAQKMGYLVVCHTVSFGAYEIANNWDRSLLTMKKGPSQIPEPYLRTEYMTNGLNGGDPWHVCPRTAYENYAVKDLPKVREYGYEGMHYVDEITACKPEKCCSPDHPVTRKQAWGYYRKIAQLSKRLFGAFQSEAWVDYINSDVDAILYASSQSFINATMNPLFDEGIPFWQLVYHGIVLSNATAQTVNYPIKEEAQHLKFIEYGGRPLMYFNSKFGENRNWMGDVDLFDRTQEEINTSVDALKAAYDEYELLKCLQYEFMENHEKLKDGVYRTTYSDGTVITVDYRTEKYTVQKGKAFDREA